MSASELCKECRDEWDAPKGPWVHCHHGPKEKSKRECWCKGIGGERAFTLIDRTIDDLVFVKFCPECGRSLK